MTVSLNARLDEQITTYVAAQGLLLTSTLGDTDYVSLKGFDRIQILIGIADGTTITKTDVTLQQATTVAGGSEKPLGFTRMLANTDYAAGKVMTETAVTANTFSTPTVNSKQLLYIIEVKASDLDVNGGFDCIRVDCTGHAATASQGCFVIYNLFGKRYSDTTQTQAIAD